jgi:prepilin-type processing-associated H-X9-DG protein
LVVIAIIGILAAMLFPVFAKAREQARKAQCLNNVKQIATGIQMYISDWDRFFPLATDQYALDWFADTQTGGCCTYPNTCNHVRQANPYLREPVILEDYLGLRQWDIWRCPSARLEGGATVITPVGRDYNWVNNYIDNADWWPGTDISPCNFGWPSGWGGAVTDSFTQRRQAINVRSGHFGGGPKCFVQGYGIVDDIHWDTPARISNPAAYIVTGDSGGQPAFWQINYLAYPDYMKGTAACGMPDSPQCSSADWINCGWSGSCGLDGEHMLQFFADPQYRKNFTRHGGGSNVGFADGHAKWFLADDLIFHAPGTADPKFSGGLGVCWWPCLCAP